MKKLKSILKAITPLDWAYLTLAVIISIILILIFVKLSNRPDVPHIVYQTETSSQQTLKYDDEHLLRQINKSSNNAKSSCNNVDESAEEPQMYFEVIDDSFLNKYIGRCRLTVYTPSEGSWGYATATGEKSQHLMTCAVDPNVIPYNSIVVITDKDGEEWRFKAIDCGNFKGNWIDIFFDGTERHGIEWLDEVFGGDFANVRIEVPVK